MVISRRRLLTSGIPAAAALAGWSAVSSETTVEPSDSSSGRVETLADIEGLTSVVGSLAVSSGATVLRRADGTDLVLAAGPEIDTARSHDISQFDLLLLGKGSTVGFQVIHLTPAVYSIEVNTSDIAAGTSSLLVRGRNVVIAENVLTGRNGEWTLVDTATSKSMLERHQFDRAVGGVMIRAGNGVPELAWLALLTSDGLWPLTESVV